MLFLLLSITLNTIRYKEQHEVNNTSTTSTTTNGVGMGLKKQTGGETPSSTIGMKRTSTDQVEGNSSATKRPRGVVAGQVRKKAF